MEDGIYDFVNIETGSSGTCRIEDDMVYIGAYKGETSAFTVAYRHTFDCPHLRFTPTIKPDIPRRHHAETDAIIQEFYSK